MTGLLTLNGNELIYVNPVDPNGTLAPILQPTTTGSIAALASSETKPLVNTTISTVGNGTLTAAGIVGGLITRSGPVAAFTDTTDTAVNIVAALPNFVAGETFFVYIRNTTAFDDTLAAGTGVTLPASIVIPSNSLATYSVAITSATAVAFTHISTVNLTSQDPPINTGISTNGNGTLTAAGIVGGLVTRFGVSGTAGAAPYTDAIDTAANIVAASPNAHAGFSFLFYLKNTNPQIQTLTAGTGITIVTGGNVLAPLTTSIYLVTFATLTAVTFRRIGIVEQTSLPIETATTLSTVGAGTITGGGIVGRFTIRSGAQSSTAFTDTTDTADNIIAAVPTPVQAMSWEYTYQNTTNAPATITGGTGVTVSGVTVVPANLTARYLVTYTAPDTITMQGISLGLAAMSTGTVVLNGATPVTVANTAVTAFSNITFTLKTVGGTVSPNAPNIKTITPGTGFTVAGTALDTSTYNYNIVG